MGRQSFASSPAVRQKMQAQRRRDTAPEMALRRALHARGLRFFVHRRPLPDLRREADIVFPRARVAVWVDGCWWHGCEVHGRRASTPNDWFWPEKIRRNQERDRDTSRRVQAAGWTVVRVWEHDRVEAAAERVSAAVAAARSGEHYVPTTVVTDGQRAVVAANESVR